MGLAFLLSPHPDFCDVHTDYLLLFVDKDKSFDDSSVLHRLYTASLVRPKGYSYSQIPTIGRVWDFP